MPDTNPYAAPQAHVEDQRSRQADEGGYFIPEGRTVEAARGWSWISEGFSLFAKQAGLWIGVVVTLGLMMIAAGFIPVVGSLATALLFPAFSAGLMIGCRELDTGGTLEFEHMFAGFKKNASGLILIGVFTLIGWVLIIVVMIAIMGAGVFAGIMRGDTTGANMSLSAILIGALVAMGLSVPLYMASWYAPALVVFHEMEPMAALKASFFACMKNKMPLLVYGVVLLFAVIVAIIPIGLGFLVLGPVIFTSIYASYRDIFIDN